MEVLAQEFDDIEDFNDYVNTHLINANMSIDVINIVEISGGANPKIRVYYYEFGREE